jgi:hypothetical protein
MRPAPLRQQVPAVQHPLMRTLPLLPESVVLWPLDAASAQALPDGRELTAAIGA